MARKQPVGYVVRRPLTLWGTRREMGEYIPSEDVASLARVEAMVRSGRFKAVYDETDSGIVVKGRTGKRDDIEIIDAPKPKRKRRKAATVEPTVEAPTVEAPTVEAPAEPVVEPAVVTEEPVLVVEAEESPEQ